MARGVDCEASFPFVLEEDRALPEGDAGRSVFHIRPLAADVKARIDDETTDLTQETEEARPMSRDARHELAKRKTAAALGKGTKDEDDGEETTTRKVNYHHGKNVVETLLAAITGIDNYPIGKGSKMLAWPGVDASREKRMKAVSCIRPAHRQEIWAAANALAVVSEDDLGESSTPSRS